MKKYIETERLILRDWKPEDSKPFAAMNQDPVVVQYLLPSTEEETANNNEIPSTQY